MLRQDWAAYLDSVRLTDHMIGEVLARLEAEGELENTIVIFMTDDAGCANGSPFGGPIQLPTMERVLKMGVGYNRFHTTAMCSPTRACVLTGRNHHAVGFGQIPEYATDFDGYVGAIPSSAATIGEVLGAYGYGTAAFGKWHNGTQSPYHPNDRGFDEYYGFTSGHWGHYLSLIHI